MLMNIPRPGKAMMSLILQDARRVELIDGLKIFKTSILLVSPIESNLFFSISVVVLFEL